MKKMIKSSPFSVTNKKITNHSARKKQIKALKQSKTPKSQITSITGHKTEAGLDAYEQWSRRPAKLIIDNHETKVC